MNFKLESKSRVYLMGEFIDNNFVQDLTFGFKNLHNISRTSSIWIFGVNIERINESDIRKRVTLLGNNALVVHGSVRRNIRQNLQIDDQILVKILHFLKLIDVIDNSNNEFIADISCSNVEKSN